MPKTKISEYSTTNADNTDIESINIAEGCAPSGINNAIRELMVHLKEFQTGASGDGFTFAGGTLMTGTNTLSGTNVLSGSTTAAFAAGTVSAPSIAAHGDTNTGIFFPAADTIAFAEGGAEAMRITSTGEVLVGGTTAVISGKGAVTIEGTDTTAYLSLFRNDTSIDSGNALGQIRFYGNDTTTNTPTSLAYVYAVASGTHAAGDNPTDLTFGTTPDNSATVAEVVRFTQAGNVGIGTSSPGAKLEVAGSTIRLTNSSAGNTALQITASGQTAGSSSFDLINDASIAYVYNRANTPLVFGTNNTERMRIDSSGNVGIGATPSAVGAYRVLELNATTGGLMYYQANGTRVMQLYGTATEAGLINMANAPLLFGSNNLERARITSGGYFKASDSGSYVGSTGTYHEFRNTGNDAALVLSATNASYTADGLQVRISRNTTNNTFYAINYYNDGAGAYKFRVADSGNVTNTNGSYGTISDAKLKQDIVDAGSQWDDIKNLRFRKYRLKADVEANPDAKPLLGLVAQEAELVSPGLIEEHRDTKQETKTRDVEKTREVEVTPAVLDEEGNVVEPAVTTTETYTETEEYTETVDLGTTTKSIKTSILYMKAVKALQEAMIRIETLEAQNAAFEARLAALEAK